MFLKLFLIGFTYLLYSTSAQIRVNVSEGEIEGQTHTIDGKSVYYFMGIPFAEPPINELRFKRPMNKTEWHGVYKATEITPQCISPWNTSADISEDCLHLNIWTPSVDPKSNLPVMYWIYGGSFIMGSATKQVDGYYIFNGTRLALRDVVLVTANYRLGAFGYLYGDSDDAPGNMGFWDQVLVLQWIQRNINAFGGNPNNVIIFGVSAGSASVSAHIVSPISRHLFSKAIMESAAIFRSETNLKEVLDFSRSFAANDKYFPSNPCLDNQNWISCLRNKSTEELLYAQNLLTNLTSFSPIIGDQFMPKPSIQALKEMDFKTDVQLLLGHSVMEGVSFANDLDHMINLGGRYDPNVLMNVTRDQVYEDIKLFSSGLSEDWIEKIATSYTSGFASDPSVSRDLIRSATHAYGDQVITCPTVLFGAELVKQLGLNGITSEHVFQYRLVYINSQSISYRSSWADAEHTDEQPLIFGRPLNEPENNWTESDRTMSSKMMQIWTDFAKTGKPSVPGVEWPKLYLRSNGEVNISNMDLNVDIQTVRADRYRGNDDEFRPKVINNCINFWSEVLSNANSNSLSNYRINYSLIMQLFIVGTGFMALYTVLGIRYNNYIPLE